MLKKDLRILIAALDWGLGHATRSIPIIKYLQSKGIDVVLASDGRALHLWKKEFPEVECIELPAYNVDYSSNNMIWNILKQGPKILKAIREEKKALQPIIARYQISHIISDNRYGIYHPDLPSAFICHQLFPITPMQGISNKVHERMLSNFDEIWVPDSKGEPNLSGKLAHGSSNLNPKFMGPLSRFHKTTTTNKDEFILVILSGPEPQRSHLEERIRTQFKEMNLKVKLVQGKTEGEKTITKDNNIEVHNFMTSEELNIEINVCKLVICRSGYSSILDLAKLEKKAILIPTPGQTEQLYLADRLEKEGAILKMDQDQLFLSTGIEEALQMNGLKASAPIAMEKILEQFIA